MNDKAQPSKWSTKRFLVVSIVLVLLAGAAGFALAWWQKPIDPHNHGPGAVPAAEEMPESQKLALDGEYDKAHGVIDKALENPNISTQEKHELLVQRGLVYEAQEKLDKAMTSYLEAESVVGSLQVVQAIANLAAKKGDKKLEITYLQKAIPLLPDDQAGEGQKRYLQDRIKYLETGKPPS